MALKHLNIHNKSFEISYDILNTNAKKDFIVLHGWGSNKELMKNSFGVYLKEFRHIYIDLPGFGKSSNKYELTTDEYAKIVEEFLKTLNSSKDIVVGHSFGGKIATLLKPKNLVLLSSAGIVEKKSIKIKIKIFFAKFFNNLGLKSITKFFRSSDVSSMNEIMYKTFKNVVNEDFSSNFKEYDGKALIFWGDKDSATSVVSGKIIANLIKNSVFVSYDDDHYFFMRNAQDIAKRVEDGIL